MSLQNTIARLEFLSSEIQTILIATYADGGREAFIVETENIEFTDTFDSKTFCRKMRRKDDDEDDDDDDD